MSEIAVGGINPLSLDVVTPQPALADTLVDVRAHDVAGIRGMLTASKVSVLMNQCALRLPLRPCTLRTFVNTDEIRWRGACDGTAREVDILDVDVASLVN